jgi:hypothetical protein
MITEQNWISRQVEKGSSQNFAFGVIVASILVNILFIAKGVTEKTGQGHRVSVIFLFVTFFSLINCIAVWKLLNKKGAILKRGLKLNFLTISLCIVPAFILFFLQSNVLGIFYTLGIIALETVIILGLDSRGQSWKEILSGSIESDNSKLILENQLSSNSEEILNPFQLEQEPNALNQEEQDNDILHRMSRSKQQDGTEIMAGMARLIIPAGIKTETVHLSFCPAFKEMPSIECETISELSVKVRVAEIRKYGARLEIRRSENIEEECPVEIEYFIQDASNEEGVIQNKNVA